ncbi:Nlp family transcriptional regulator [Orbus hercynius]|uniref:Nlp family transcriptional regulator n=1 Tax=Orbus hercynius TaxID=593135 RepID=A0A495RH80_9GAMM|nr:helix-turn-helix transcriptional regulator [Orbus hercynius]RKS86887.1 Nlp family transcriptional regulator [Orbus hercynius]
MKEKDWHPADIIAALKKKGTSLSALSRQSGYAPSTLANALVRPWTKGELIIASVLGIEPKQIWPSRYANKNRVVRIKNTDENNQIPFSS